MNRQGAARILFENTYGSSPALLARAPGRIEVIGNHTDYNGGTVLGAAIDRSIEVAFRLRTDGEMAFVSDFSSGVVRLTDGIARREGADAWANYPIGVLASLEKRGLRRTGGFEMAITSDLPSGAGLSSSAALELSSALVLTKAFGLDLDRRELAMAAREAENEFVGMPCGILDQGVSAFGRRDQLVHIDCRGPDFSTVPIPAGVHFWIFNTHQKHALVESLYSTRHRECMEAVTRLQAFLPEIQQLADIDPDQLREVLERLPDPVGRRARHVVEEISRVRKASGCFASGDLSGAGALLYASHESSRLLFENSTVGLDDLVDRLRNRPGVYGARLTGGGFGGAVLAMTDEAFAMDDARAISGSYGARFGQPAEIIHVRTADGASLCP
ncbi:MAG: galactokinase [Opitutaceae bacterium]